MSLQATFNSPQHIADASQMDEADIAKLESCAFEYGRGYDSYLVMELNRQYFWSADRRGVVGFVNYGRYTFVTGGLLAPEEACDSLLEEFLAFCRASRRNVTFFNIDEEHLPHFRRRGFQITKTGEDAIVDLKTTTFKGKAYEWVRRQTNFCKRQGLACQEISPDISPNEWPALAEQLQQVSDEFLRGKPHGQRMKYFVGKFDLARLGRQRIFVARADQGAGRIEGFILCNPCRGGEVWAIEMFRQRRHAVRGVIPFIMHQAMAAMQAEGAPYASLCMVPTLRCQEPLEGDSPLIRWFMKVSADHLGPIYDIQGMYHFKSRFRPDFQACYACVYPKATLLSLRAAMIVWGADRINPLRLAVRYLRHRTKRAHRQTLAKPESPE